jgi:probable phosphoglycerate mutase
MTSWNEMQLWQGVVDTELSSKGIEQATKIGKFFKSQNISVDIIYSSPMKRAFQTAKLIASTFGYDDEKIYLDPRLRECEVVLWNGKTIDEITNKYSEEFKIWQTTLYSNIQGVESLGSVQNRVFEFLQEKLVQNAGKNVIIVSHAITLRMLIIKVLNLYPPNHLNFSLDNASISGLEITNGRIRVKFLNYTFHL